MRLIMDGKTLPGKIIICFYYFSCFLSSVSSLSGVELEEKGMLSNALPVRFLPGQMTESASQRFLPICLKSESTKAVMRHI